MSTIFIPKKIKVGFQERSDTFTKKLAYVTYFDEKGTLRKEHSWNGWRDETIEPLECDNVPTSGFVLNKKVGGDRYHWNTRNTYVRIYDPRDFEFELTIPNLLFILENTNSIKGKGLEGEFVYGWSGSDIVLVPTSSPDYEDLTKLNDLRHSKTFIKGKDLILGATYLTKANRNLIYMGKFTQYSFNKYAVGDIVAEDLGQYLYFIDSELNDVKLLKTTSGTILAAVDSNCVNNYSELFQEKIENNPIYTPIDHSKTIYVPYKIEDFVNKSGDFLNYKIFYSFISGKFIWLYLCGHYRNSVRCYNSEIRFERTYSTVEEAFNDLKPHYQIRFLKNGHQYSNSK